MYGAMYPPFIRDYIERTNLTNKSRFIDLGCGIGQFVMQVEPHYHLSFFYSLHLHLRLSLCALGGIDVELHGCGSGNREKSI